jgi:hypothetical protein
VTTINRNTDTVTMSIQAYNSLCHLADSGKRWKIRYEKARHSLRRHRRISRERLEAVLEYGRIYRELR